MMRLNPFSWLNDSAKVPALITLIVCTFILTIVLSAIGSSLKNEAAPLGIISFELAGSKSRADIITASWSDAARRDAFLSLGVDYLYLFVYPLAISLACHLIAAKGNGAGAGWSKVGTALSWLVLAAAPLDAVENYALISVLKSSTSDLWPAVAKWCAIPKFALVAIGNLYAIAWLLTKLVNRITQRPKAKAV